MMFASFNSAKKDAARKSRMAFRVSNATASAPVEIQIYDYIGESWDGTGVFDRMFSEALNNIPADKDIVIRINSQGGSVKDGLAIHNLVKARRDRVTCVIDGYALSTASWIAIAGKETLIPANGAMMIHNPSAWMEGDSEDFRKAAEMLDQHKKMILSMYVEKTGKPESEISKAMDEETWLVGQEAVDYGLADKLTGAAANISNNFDLSRFGRVPERIREIVKNAAAKSGKATNTMNKEKLIALLAEHGVKVENDASEESLLLKLKELTAKAKAAPSEGTDNEVHSQLLKLTNQIASVTNELSEARKREEAERKKRVSREVEELATNRIPADQINNWVTRALADETVLNDLRSLPVNLPGTEPVRPVIDASAAPADILNGFGRFNEASKSFMRGNDIAPAVLARNSTEKALFYRKHKAAMSGVLNANTIPAELKRQAILQDVIEDFARILLPLRAFSTVFSNVPLQGTSKVNVPFYDLDATASNSWNSGNGYNTMGDTTAAQREIQIGSGATNGDRKWIGLATTSEEIARQPYLDILRLIRLRAEKLASDIFTNVLSVVTAANFGAAAKAKTADAFDSDDVVDLRLACKLWPQTGRTLIIDSAYDAALCKDQMIKSVLHSGSSDALRDGKIMRLFGFDYMTIPTIPGNSENLVGFATFTSSILLATAPVPPSQEVRNSGTSYEVVTDPNTGISFEYRHYGDNTLDTGKHTIECSYGFAKGNGNALKRIVSA